MMSQLPACGNRITDAAALPIVIDVVYVKACSINHFCAYGFWAPAIGDYTRHKIFERSDTKEHDALMRIEDP